ncbi:MAG: stage III sporulation protein J, partial [Lachnospiraceae bacterium]|nr:stage III sporulation protein J [Lachnospiraceae bacterium]
YWIAGSVVRSIQQVVINKHIDKMDIDEVIKKNTEKRNKKLEKAGIDPKTLNKNATLNTRNMSTGKPSMSSKAKVAPLSQEERDEAVRKSTEYYNKNAKPGSLASKANMVRQYNEKNNK